MPSTKALEEAHSSYPPSIRQQMIVRPLAQTLWSGSFAAKALHWIHRKFTGRNAFRTRYIYNCDLMYTYVWFIPYNLDQFKQDEQDLLQARALPTTPLIQSSFDLDMDWHSDDNNFTLLSRAAFYALCITVRRSPIPRIMMLQLVQVLFLIGSMSAVTISLMYLRNISRILETKIWTWTQMRVLPTWI